MYTRSGEIFVRGTTALVSQTAWIENVSIRENILFGLPIKSHRYEEALNMACLDQDLEKMTGGDQTQVIYQR